MAELGEVRTADFVVCILVYGDGAPTKKAMAGWDTWETSWVKRSLRCQLTPSPSSIQHLPIPDPMLSPLPLLYLQLSTRPAQPWLPSQSSSLSLFLTVLSPMLPSPLDSAVILVYVMHLRTWVVTTSSLLWRPFSMKAFGTRQMDSNSGSTTW